MNNNIKIAFDTLGCAKNTCDTSSMKKIVERRGYNVVDYPEKCDVIVLNTCCFIQAAAEESIQTFFEYKQTFPDKIIIVCGCLPSRYGRDLEDALTEADAFISCNEENTLPDIIDRLCSVNTSANVYEIPIKKTKSTFSYIKISEGCDKFCSYCAIPYIRGRYYSYSYKDIKKDIKNAIKTGVREIVLVAQDCGEWGSDLTEEEDLSYLLKNLAEEFTNTLFRVLYVLPDSINEKLLKVISEHNNICNYLDIPLQHCSKNVLNKMNRQGSYSEYISLIKNVRNNIPECTLRTTLIVGFPGETKKDFSDLCEFVREIEFDYVGVFKFSREEGTEAFDLPCQLDEQIKDERLNIIRSIADEISFAKIDKRIGSKCNIIIEGQEDGRYYGRGLFQAPDVDGYVYLNNKKELSKKSYKAGQSVSVKIINTELYDLVGESY